jgi:hypothetical protein
VRMPSIIVRSGIDFWQPDSAPGFGAEKTESLAPAALAELDNDSGQLVSLKASKQKVAGAA